MSVVDDAEKEIVVDVGDGGPAAQALKEMVSEPETGTEEPSSPARLGPLPSRSAVAIGAAAEIEAPASAEHIWVAVDCGGGSVHSHAGDGGEARVASLTGTAERLTGGKGDGEDILHVGDQLRMSWSKPGGATRGASAGAEAAVVVVGAGAGARAGPAPLRPRTKVSRAGGGASGAEHWSGIVAPEIKLELACMRVVPPGEARVRAGEGPAAAAGSGSPTSTESGRQMSAAARGAGTACRERIDGEATAAIAGASTVASPCLDGTPAAGAQRGEVGATGVPAQAVDGEVKASTEILVAMPNSSGVVTTKPQNGDGLGHESASEKTEATIGMGAGTAAAAAAGNAEAKAPVAENTLCEPSRDVGPLEKPCYLYLQVIGPSPSEEKVRTRGVLAVYCTYGV